MIPEIPAAPKEVNVEIREGKPWWKVCCTSCFLFLLLAFVLLYVAFRGIGGKGPQNLTALPKNFPPSVSLYRPEDTDTVTYFAGKDKDRFISMLFAPFKFFAGVMVASREADGDVPTGTGTGLKRLMEGGVNELQRVDTVTIRWERLPASRDELHRFYIEQFQRNGFAIDSRRDAATATDLVVARSEDVQVQLQVQDLPDIEGIDSIIMIVDYLNQ